MSADPELVPLHALRPALQTTTWKYPIGAVVRLRTDPPGPHAGEEVKIKTQTKSTTGFPCYVTYVVGDSPQHDFFISEDRIEEVLDASRTLPTPTRPEPARQRIAIARSEPTPMPRKNLPEPAEPPEARGARLRMTAAQIEKETPVPTFAKLAQKEAQTPEKPRRGRPKKQQPQPEPVSAPEERESEEIIHVTLKEIAREWTKDEREALEQELANIDGLLGMAGVPAYEQCECCDGPYCRSDLSRRVHYLALDRSALRDQVDAAREAGRAEAWDLIFGDQLIAPEDWQEQGREMKAAAEEVVRLRAEVAELKVKVGNRPDLVSEIEKLRIDNQYFSRRAAELERRLWEALASQQPITVNGGTVTIINKETQS